MTTQYDVLVAGLNQLIEINYSRIDGYKKASEDIDGGDLKGLFQGMVNESVGFADSLAEHVVKFHGEPTTETTFMGKVHQVWLDFKASYFRATDAGFLFSLCSLHKTLLKSDGTANQHQDCKYRTLTCPPSDSYQ